MDHEISFRGAIVSDFVAPTFQFNPVVTAWEVVTLSFVVDWILNVGRALNAISFLATSEAYTASYSIDYRHVRTYERTVLPKAGWWHNTAGYVQEHMQVLKRTPCTVPSLPRLSVNLDSFKVLDLIALFLQRIR